MQQMRDCRTRPQIFGGLIRLLSRRVFPVRGDVADAVALVLVDAEALPAAGLALVFRGREDLSAGGHVQIVSTRVPTRVEPKMSVLASALNPGWTSVALLFTIAPRLVGVDQAASMLGRVAVQRSEVPDPRAIGVEEDLQTVGADRRAVLGRGAVQLGNQRRRAPGSVVLERRHVEVGDAPLRGRARADRCRSTPADGLRWRSRRSRSRPPSN